MPYTIAKRTTHKQTTSNKQQECINKHTHTNVAFLQAIYKKVYNI